MFNKDLRSLICIYIYINNTVEIYFNAYIHLNLFKHIYYIFIHIKNLLQVSKKKIAQFKNSHAGCQKCLKKLLSI